MEKTKKNRRVRLPQVMMFVRFRGFIDRLFGNYSYDKSSWKFSSPYIIALISVISTVVPQKREEYAKRLYVLSDTVTQTCIELDSLPSAENAAGAAQQKRAEARRKAMINELYKNYSVLHRELSNTTIPEEEEIQELSARVNHIMAHYMRGFNTWNRAHAVSSEDFPFLNETDRERIHNEFMNIRSGEYVKKALEHVSRELASYEE